MRTYMRTLALAALYVSYGGAVQNTSVHQFMSLNCSMFN